MYYNDTKRGRGSNVQRPKSDLIYVVPGDVFIAFRFCWTWTHVIIYGGEFNLFNVSTLIRNYNDAAVDVVMKP